MGKIFRAKPGSITNGKPGTEILSGSQPPSLAAHLGLVAVLLLFVSLATLFSLVAPITQGEDELAHYRYVSFIAQTGRLPVDEVEREQAWYRSDWPPLYHLLVGWGVSWLDTTRPHLKDVGESPRRRLVGEIFYPRLIIYTEDARWPWQDGILAWHLGRFVSIVFASAALVFTYLTALEIIRSAEEQSHGEAALRRRGEKENSPPLLSEASLRDCSPAPILPLATVALLAFTPRYLFTSAMLGDDSLFIFLSAIFIWLLLRALRGADQWWLYALMGLLLGLSIATKYSTGLLPLVIIPVVWWRARQAGWRWSQALGRLGLAWLFTLIGSGWWFGWLGYHFNTIEEDGLFFGLLRPMLAAGPDVSMKRVFALFTATPFTGPERPDAVAAGTLWDWLVYLFQTFWGVPVLESDPFFPWLYLLMFLFGLLALVGLWHLWRQVASQERMTLALLGLIVALLLPFPLLRFFLTHNVLETGQGRHILYPAAQAIPILLIFGWAAFWTGRRAGRSTLLVALWPLLLLLWSIALLFYMQTAYPEPLPVQTTTFDPAAIPQPLSRPFGDELQFLGYDFEPDPDLAVINLTLYWQALKLPSENYRTRVQLVDPAGQPHFTWLSHPLNGRYPIRAWDQGDVVRDKLPLPLAAVPPNRYDILIDLLPEADDAPLTEAPLQLIQFTLPARQPIPDASTMAGVEYRLWAEPGLLARQRQTLPLSWRADETVEWSLVGPDETPRPPEAVGETTVIFIVDPGWPSGDYRLLLELENGQAHRTEPLVTVANEARLFDLSTEDIPGFAPAEAVFGTPEGGPQMKLLGYTLPVRRVEPGGGLPLTLYWQSLAPVLEDAVTFAVLLDAGQQPHGSVDRYPSGYYSPLLWAEGEVVVDEFVLPVQPDAPPGVYQLHVGQYRLVDGQPESLPLLAENEPTGQTAVIIGPLKVGGPPPAVVTTTPNPQIRLNQTFGDQITLVGYDSVVEGSTRRAQTLKLLFYWRADSHPPSDYTTFVHLRDPAGRTVAQKDSPPAGGRYPTGLWEPGEVIVDEVTLSLVELPEGEYRPVVGLYELATGARLPVPGVPANELALDPIQLEP